MNEGFPEGYRFGRFTLNLARASLQSEGADIELRPKVFDVLRYLVEHAGRVATKDEIVAAVWPDVTVSDDSLAQCIHHLRKALEDEGERFIKTVPRRGYMFVADVAPLGGPGPPPPLEAAAVARPARRRAAAVVAGAAVAVIAGALAAWSGGWFAAKPPAQGARLTIAVLPFANVGENPGEEWLGDGIAEDIITAVSRFRDFTVIARNSSFRYRGQSVDVQKIGRELGADFLLQGTVRRSGERLRITAQLVDARSVASLWTERYDRPFVEVFAVQEEVADSVATQLTIHAREIAATRLKHRPPDSLEAYELVLRGRKAYLIISRESTTEAMALAERAIALDPNYAPAWELLAAASLQFYIQPYSEHQGTPAMLARARAAAEKAISLDANFATAHGMLAFVLLWSRELEASLESVNRAISLNPNYAGAYAIHAIVLNFVDRYRESIEVWERVERLDPFNPPLSLALKAQSYVMLRDFEPALRLTRSCAQRAPRVYPCHLFLAIAASQLGLEDEAREAARRVLELYPKFTVERHMRITPFRGAAAEQFTAYLRRAGLPE